MTRSVKRTSEHVANKFKIKVAMTGPDDHAVLRVLSRSIRWAARGVVYESGHRYTDSVVQELQVPNKEAVVTPALRESKRAQEKG